MNARTIGLATIIVILALAACDGGGGGGGGSSGSGGGTPNTPPVANADSAQVLQGDTVSVDVLANDSDPEGDSLSISAVSTPANGTAAIVAGMIDYTPAISFTGDDSFTYDCSDDEGAAAVATVTVTVVPSWSVASTASFDSISDRGAFDIELRDLNADGRKEVVYETIVPGSSTGTDEVRVLMNQSSSGNVAMGTPGPYAGAGVWSMDAADFNGDGKMDFVVANALNQKTITVYLSHPVYAGQLSAGQAFTATLSSAFTVVAGVCTGDFDGDGKPDIAATVIPDGQMNELVVFRNTSVGGVLSFTHSTVHTIGNKFYYVKAGDLNGDGKLDLAYSHAANNSSGVQSDIVGLLLNASSGPGNMAFTWTGDITASGYWVEDIALGDLNADGTTDIAIGSRSGLSVWLNQSPSGAGSLTLGARQDFSTIPGLAGAIGGVEIADLNGDSRLDLVATNPQSGVVHVFLSRTTTGAATLNLMTHVDFGAGALAAAYISKVADMDGDGVADLVTCNSSVGGPRIVVMRGQIP